MRNDFPEAVITMEGHSGYGYEGADVVCAGISAVVQTALAGIAGVALLPQTVKTEKGYLGTTIKTGGRDRQAVEKLEVIVATMILGLKEIEKSYPGSLELVFKED